MKNKITLLLCFLPALFFGQTDLVRWNNTNFTPTVVASNITSGNITVAGGVSLSHQDWGNTNNFFQMGSWPTPQQNGGGIDTGKYVEFIIAPEAGYKIDLDQFRFYYRAQGTPQNFQVRYSKNNFSSYFTMTGNTSSSTSWTSVSGGLSSVNPVMPGETVRIRVYAYNTNNNFHIKRVFNQNVSNNHTQTPTITGTVSTATPPEPVANNDTASTCPNTAATINILANNGNGADTYATLSAITITQQPANGQNIVVNGLTNVTYTPNNGFVGSDSFKYTITDQNGTSNEATVTVNVTQSVTNNDSSTTYQNMPVTINVLGNDTNISGITSINVSSPSANGGTVVANGVTNVTYTPSNNYTGSDTFTYTITTACGTSNSSTVTVLVNDAPLAEWALTSNANVTFEQSFVDAESLALGGYSACYDATGAKIWGHNNANIEHYRFFDVKIKPTAGNIISVSNLLFEQQTTGSSPTNYTVRYYIAENHSIPSTSELYGAASVLIPEESINGNQVKNVALGPLVINSNQTLVVRFYTKGNQWGSCSDNNWLIKSNTLKLLGKKLDPLAGSYTIGNGAGADYSTLTAAVNALNSVGVSAPVTFLLDKNMFENTVNFSNGEVFPLTINPVSGSSATNTVTFKPAPGRQNVTIRVSNLAVGSNDLRPTYLFKLNGADNIIFDGSNNNSDSKNLHIRNNSNYNDNRTVVWLTEGANNNIFRNMFIEQVETASWAYASGIFAGANSTVGSESNNPASSITVNNNQFLGVKQGVYLANSSNNYSTNYNIYFNDFGDPNQQNLLVNSVYLKGAQGFNVYNNNIYDVYVTWTGSGYHSGVYVLGNSINGKIYKNRIRSIFGNATNTLTSGIRLASSNSASDVGISVTNNFVSNIRSAGGGGFTQGAYSIYAETGRGYKIWHNSVNTTLNNPVGLTAGLMVDQARDLDVRNNIFINRATEASSYKFAISVNGNPGFSQVFSHLNYNNYQVYEAQSQSFTASYGNLTNQSVSNPGYLKTLANWQAVTPASMDVNSGSDMTTFISATNLHISDNLSWVNNTGVGLSAEFASIGLPYDDIDDQPRNNATPDIGADEFGVPLPEPGACEVTLFWNGSQWLDADDNPTSPTTNFKTQLNAPYNTELHGSFATCELTVATGGSLRIDGGDHVYIVNRLINNLTASAVVVENNGSIVQETDFNDNQGNITYKRTTNPMYNYDYTYWSSPVAGQTTQNLSSGSGNFRYRFDPAVVYQEGYYFQYGWRGHNGVMQPGHGYIIKAPNSFPNNPASTPLNFTANFVGVPNSGPIQVAVGFGNDYSPSQLPTANEENPATGYPDGDYGWYYFGNPYPSAIDAAKFRNFSGNDDILGTTIYMWAHNTQPVLPEDGDLYQYVSNDFAVFNTSFMDGTQASPYQPQNPGSGGATSQNPNYNAAGRYIAAGQGFFMPAKIGTVFFNNSMRVNPAYPQGDMPNNHFYRMATGVNSPELPPSSGNDVTDQEVGDPNIHKMKLSIQNEQGAFHQIMLGYIEGATNGLDNTDGVVFGGSSYVTLYSIAEEAALVIQGRAMPFSPDDQVPLGVRLDGISGTFTINLDHTDGMFRDEYGNQNIYLEDTYLNVIHDLKVLPSYEFTSEEGIFNDRFVLRYMNPLNVNETKWENNWGVYSKDGQLEVFSVGFDIKKIDVYDITGRLVYQKNNIDAANHTIDKINGNQILIVRITSEDNKSSVKKIKN